MPTHIARHMANAFLPDSDKLSHLNFSAHSSSLNPVSTKPSPTAGGRQILISCSLSVYQKRRRFSAAPRPTLTKGQLPSRVPPFVSSPGRLCLLRRVSFLLAPHSRIRARQGFQMPRQKEKAGHFARPLPIILFYPHCASLSTVIYPFSSTAPITQETL